MRDDARVNSTRERSAPTRLVRSSATTRACGRAGSRTVIYVPIYATCAIRVYQGECDAKETERRARVYMRARGRARVETAREGYVKKDRDVRDEGKGLRRGGVQGQERRDKERTDETTGAGEKEITAGSDRVVEINVARLIGATEECACGLSGSQLAASLTSVADMCDDFRHLIVCLRDKLRAITL